MAGISVSGVGSGIEINSLVDQLVAAERDPVAQRLDLKEATYQTQLSSFGLLKSALADVQSSVTALGKDGLFQERTATSSNPDIFGATPGEDAAPGSYSVRVEQLATSHKVRTGGYESAGTVVGTGTLAIRSGDTSFSVDVTAANDTLEGIRDSINAAPENTAVSASIVNVDDGLGGTESRLVLSAREGGTANAITVTAFDDDGGNADAAGLSQLAYDPGAGITNLVEVEAPLDARMRVDGQVATRSSNTIDDLIDGVTLSLKEADPDNDYTLTIGKSTEGADEAIRSFVNAFNSFVEAMNSATSYNPDTQQAGILLGDSTVRMLESSLRGALTSRVPGGASGLDSLGSLGIRTGEDGILTIDGDQLGAALAGNPGGVEALFSGDDGLVASVTGAISGYVQTNGLLDIRTDGLNARLEDIGTQRERLDDRMDALQSRLLSQFSAMDKLVAELQSTGNFLTEQLSSLQNLSPGNNK